MIRFVKLTTGRSPVKDVSKHLPFDLPSKSMKMLYSGGPENITVSLSLTLKYLLVA